MRTAAREELEEYLRLTMLKLCPQGNGPQAKETSPLSDVSTLFEIDAKFDMISAVLGRARSSKKLTDAELPPSLQNSVEHRFALDSWPNFEFVVCESPSGYAWGHRFARVPQSAPPPIREASDLYRWSHTLDEIFGFVGPPIEMEGWFPWNSGIFKLPEGRLRLCFVFDLLQSVSKE
jgi:hypothetical protein